MKIPPWSAAILFLLFFTAFTRLFLLGTVPQGLSWDEAALGYVGKMVVTTGRDEHGQLLPVTFLSFGDYKAPLAMYLTGIFTALFGLSSWATRLPFALAGIGSVYLMTKIGSRVFANRWYGLLCGWLLAITPWYLLFSRVAFESGLALFFLLLFLWSWLEARVQSALSVQWKVTGAIGIVGALYTYHSAKIVIPLVLGLIFWHEWHHNRHWIQQNTRKLFVFAAGIGIFLLPLAKSLFFDQGTQRAQQTLVIFQEGSVLTKLQAILSGLASHLSLQFLVFGQTDSLRHGTGMWGVFSFAQLLLLLLGISYGIGKLLDQLAIGKSFFLFKWVQRLLSRATAQSSIPAWFWLAFGLIGLLPAALGFEVPHANRALLALPAAIFLMVIAVKELEKDLPHLLFSSLLGSLLLLASLEFFRFWSFYHGPYRLRSSGDWLEGYAEAVQLADAARQQGKTVKFTTQYGQPEIFFGFYLDIPAQEYRERRASGVTFGPVTAADAGQFDLVIAAPSEIFPLSPSIIVERQDHSPAFFVYEKQ